VFLKEWEIDFAISEPGSAASAVKRVQQRGYPAVVMRYITADMPKLDVLGLPEVDARPYHDEARPRDDGGGHGLRQEHVHRGE